MNEQIKQGEAQAGFLILKTPLSFFHHYFTLLPFYFMLVALVLIAANIVVDEMQLQLNWLLGV